MKSMSQYNGFQDLFALFINENKPGFILDLGCRKPTDGSNAILLIQNGWFGLGIDLTDYSEDWMPYSEKYTFVNADVTNKNFMEDIFTTLPNMIDFLSLDVDEFGLEALNCIDFNNYKFKSICIEHDFYIRGEQFRQPQRKILNDFGYTRVIQTAAEDWYVKKELVSQEITEKLNKIPPHDELIEKDMPMILEWLEIDNS